MKPPLLLQILYSWNGINPEDGFVPNEQTAIAIAVAVWTAIYGEKAVERQKPYKATLEGGFWRVEGSPEASKGASHLGGVAVAIISKKDGEINCVCRRR